MDELNIEILQGIGGWGFTYQGLVNQLRGFKGNKIRVPLNSFGGDAFAALAIHNTFREHPAQVEINIVAYAASAGTMIACAGDYVTLSDNGFYMMHNPSGYTEGEADRHDTTAQLLRDLKASMVEMYYARMEKGCKAKGQAPMLTREDISNLMSKTTWMPAADALKYGFVDALTKGAKFTASAELDFFENVPTELKAAIAPPVTSNSQPSKKMENELQFVAGFLGLAPTATLAQVNDAISDLRAKAAQVPALQAQVKALQDENKGVQANEAKQLLDAALAEQRINNEQRPHLEKVFANDHQTGKDLLATYTTKVVKLSDVNSPQANGATGASGSMKTYEGKTYAELWASDPDRLKQLKETQFEVFKALFKAEYNEDYVEPKKD